MGHQVHKYFNNLSVMIGLLLFIQTTIICGPIANPLGKNALEISYSNNYVLQRTTLSPGQKEMLLSRGWGESTGLPFSLTFSNYARIKKQQEQFKKQQQENRLNKHEEQNKTTTATAITKNIVKNNKSNNGSKFGISGAQQRNKNLNIPLFLSNNWGPGSGK